MDIFQPCPSFNKLNTFQWFKEHTCYLEDFHDPHNRNEAFKRACETDPMPLGVFYLNPEKTPFEENIGIYRQNKSPLFKRRPDIEKLRRLMENFKSPA
ncbi:hypothetical protein ACFL02_01875 [Planctomycetota bacterium]